MTGQCSGQQQKIERDKARPNKDQDMCPDGHMTGGDDWASLGSRAGLGHNPPENCTDAVPREGGLQESLRYPSALNLRVILLASLGPRGSKITDIQTARNLRKSFNSLVLGMSKWA